MGQGNGLFPLILDLGFCHHQRAGLLMGIERSHTDIEAGGTDRDNTGDHRRLQRLGGAHDGNADGAAGGHDHGA